VRDFIDQVETELPGTVVIADMEAGLEHLSIGSLRYIDLLLVVVQPTLKTMMTADRAYKLALELGIPEVAFIANRVRQPADIDQLEAFAREHGSRLFVTIPEDDEVRNADAQAQCLIDVAPDSPTVQAVGRLAEELEGRFFRAGAPTG
jgi:CO dehydrogenase maturation factor